MSPIRTLRPFLFLGALMLVACAGTQTGGPCLGMDLPDAYRMRARLFLENEERDSAALYYSKAIAVDSLHAKTLAEYVQVLFRGDDRGITDTAQFKRILDLHLKASDYEGYGVSMRLHLYAEQGQYVQGVALLEKVYEGKPSSMDWGRIQGELCRGIYAEGMTADSRPSEICMNYLEVLQGRALENPGRVALWEVLRDMQETAGMDSAACSSQGRVWAADTTRLEALHAWGSCQYRIESGKAASLEYLLARPEIESQAYAREMLAQKALIAHDTLQAVEHLQQKLVLDRGDVETALDLAKLYEAMKRHAQRQALLDTMLGYVQDEYQKQSLYLAKAQGYMQEAKGKPLPVSRELYRQALPLLKLVVKGNENDAPLISYLAYAYGEADSLEQAVSYLERALELEPDEANYLNNLAFTLFEAKHDMARGMRLIDSALAKDPGHAVYEETRAWGLYNMGKASEALDALEALEERGVEALEEQGVSRLDLWEHMAEVCATLGQTDRSRSYRLRMLKVEPGHERARLAIGGAV